MKKLNMKKTIVFTMVSLLLFTCINIYKVKADSDVITRIGGANRYETAAMVAKKNWTSECKNVILVSGTSYADALSATTLGKVLDAPIILSCKYYLPKETEDVLDCLQPDNVYVIGGNGVIGSNVKKKIRKSNYNLIELSGQNRFNTNIVVANYLVNSLGVDPSEVFAVNGQEGFADALSVAPIASSKSRILLLVSRNPESAKLARNFVSYSRSNVTVIGTKFMVPEETYKMLSAKERIKGGQDRFETNLNILERYKYDLRDDKFYVANVTNVRRSYSDPLTVSVLAGKYNSPLVLMDLVDREGTKHALEYIKQNIKTDGQGDVIGGEGVIPDSLIRKIDHVIKNKIEIK
ncbi:cell wall-binding repeat-containing protein [Clostridium oceanicum]|uniref:N-acetylmuramoyl-L-alanine amidase LytC n=1 Tax=Clostridium oceanicum TaxID=1543 RepID=A0ABP3V0V9_9CLOT